MPATSAQEKSLRGGSGLAEPEEVDQQFGDVAGAGSTDVRDAVGHHGQQRAVALQEGVLPADVEPQPPRGGVRGRTSDGRLQHTDSVGGSPLPAGFGVGRRVTAHVDPGGPGRQRPENGVIDCRRHLGGPGKDGEEHVRPRRGGCR